ERHFFVWNCSFAGDRKMRVQLPEQFIFSSQRAFLGQPIKRCTKQRLRPLTFVNALSTPSLRAHNSCVRLSDGGSVEPPQNPASAALPPAVVSAHVSHKMFERAEQKGTEPSLLRIGFGISA